MAYLGVRTTMVAAGCSAVAAGVILLLVEQRSKAALWDRPVSPAPLPLAEPDTTIEPTVNIALPAQQ